MAETQCCREIYWSLFGIPITASSSGSLRLIWQYASGAASADSNLPRIAARKITYVNRLDMLANHLACFNLHQ